MEIKSRGGTQGNGDICRAGPTALRFREKLQQEGTRSPWEFMGGGLIGLEDIHVAPGQGESLPAPQPGEPKEKVGKTCQGVFFPSGHGRRRQVQRFKILIKTSDMSAQECCGGHRLVPKA